MRINNSRTISYADLAHVPTPPPTDSWKPMPHIKVMSTVIDHVTSGDLNIDDIKYQIVDVKNSQYPDLFATMYMQSDNGTYQNILGVRNSRNKRFGAAACSGSRVMVCSNGCFSGEHIISAKHTKNVESNFADRVSYMINDVITNWGYNEARYSGYKAT